MVDQYQHIESGDHVAIKTYSIPLGEEDSESRTHSVLIEIEFLRELKDCKNIVQLREVYFCRTPQGLHLSLVMDMAKHGSLLTKMTAMQRRFSEEETRTIMIQLLLTVDLMHRNGMIHRDIKLDNVLILEEDTLDICIADLGMACRATDLS